MLRGTKECLINYFAFYYNNAYQVYKDAKYSVSYQLQELKLLEFRGTNKPLRRLDIKDDKFNIGEIFTNDEVTKVAYQEHVDLKTVIIEVETKSTIEQGLVMEVITLLDTASIALRDIREVRQ